MRRRKAHHRHGLVPWVTRVGGLAAVLTSSHATRHRLRSSAPHCASVAPGPACSSAAQTKPVSESLGECALVWADEMMADFPAVSSVGVRAARSAQQLSERHRAPQQRSPPPLSQTSKCLSILDKHISLICLESEPGARISLLWLWLWLTDRTTPLLLRTPDTSVGGCGPSPRGCASIRSRARVRQERFTPTPNKSGMGSAGLERG